MIGSDNRQFLFKLSSGKLVNFYHNNNKILYRSKTGDRNWTNPAVLADNSYSSFYVLLDRDDSLHIISQDLVGNVNYHKFQDNKATRIPLLKSTSTNVYERHMSIILNNTIPIFVYTIQNNNGTSLVYQYFKNRQPVKPLVIDLVPENKIPYTITSLDNPYIIYPVLSGNYVQIGYRHILENYRLGELKIISNAAGNCEAPKCIDLPDKSLHIIYNYKTTTGTQIIYQNKQRGENSFSRAKQIYSTNQTFTHSSLLYSNDTLYIYWLRNGQIYYVFSNDGGNNFSSIRHASVSGVPRLYRASYSSNIDIEARCDDEPMYIGNSINHVFYVETQRKPAPPTPISITADNEVTDEKSEQNDKHNENVISNQNEFTGLRQHISRVDKDMVNISSNMVNLSSKIRSIEDDVIALRDLANEFKSTIEDFSQYIKEQGSKNINEIKGQIKPVSLKSQMKYKIAREKE